MASGRYRGQGPVRGSIRGKDKNWLQEGSYFRRVRYAKDTAESAIGQTSTCKQCGGVAECHSANATEELGAVSHWKCRGCLRLFQREISPEKMEQYYQEDKAKMHAKAPEAEA